MKEKKHLTQEGLEEIKQIKAGMNTGRKNQLIIFINIRGGGVEGLIKIVAIKASMNWGLSEELKKAFPNVVPVVRPLIKNHPRSSVPDSQ